MTLKRARELATAMREAAKRCIDLTIAEGAMVVLDDQVTELEAQRDDLLAVCKDLLPGLEALTTLGVENIHLKHLKAAIAKAEGEARRPLTGNVPF